MPTPASEIKIFSETIVSKPVYRPPRDVLVDARGFIEVHGGAVEMKGYENVEYIILISTAVSANNVGG